MREEDIFEKNVLDKIKETNTKVYLNAEMICTFVGGE